MRIRTTFIAVMLTALLLFVSTGCDSNNNSADPADTHTDETVSTGPSTGYEVGDIMPDFSIPLVGGGTFTLSEHRGQPVFINLFATWCPPCVAEMPEINQLYGEYSDQVAFIVIDIDPGEDEALIQSYADDNGYSLPFAYSENSDLFGFVQYIPDTFVLDANGVIVAFREGGKDYDTFKADIDAALGQ